MELKKIPETEEKITPPTGPFDPVPFGLKPAGWGDLLLYLLGGFGVYLLVSILIGVVYFGLLGNQEDEMGLGVLVVLLLSNVVITGGSPWVLGVLRKRISWALIGISPPRWDWGYLLVVPGLAALIYFPLNSIGIGFETLINGSTAALEARSEMLMLGGPTFSGFLIVWLLVGVLVPFAEEFYFRGLIYPWFRQRFGANASIIISAILFGLAHFDSVGATLQAFIMGVVMAAAMEKTRSLYVPFLLHASINSASVVLLYFSMAAIEYF